MKNKTTALVLSIFLGGIGIDRFYLGYTGMGILKLLTGGCLGILWLVDIIMIATGSLRPADGSGYRDEAATGSNYGQPVSNAYDELEKAANLHTQGVLSDEEFANMKAKLLERL